MDLVVSLPFNEPRRISYGIHTPFIFLACLTSLVGVSVFSLKAKDEIVVYN